MPLHYLDEREPLECSGCPSCGKGGEPPGGWQGAMGGCDGTGRLDVEDAKPDISIDYVFTENAISEGYYVFPAPRGWGAGAIAGPFPTKAAAFEAARLAHKGGN